MEPKAILWPQGGFWDLSISEKCQTSDWPTQWCGGECRVSGRIRRELSLVIIGETVPRLRSNWDKWRVLPSGHCCPSLLPASSVSRGGARNREQGELWQNAPTVQGDNEEVITVCHISLQCSHFIFFLWQVLVLSNLSTKEEKKEANTDTDYTYNPKR